jgi:hypothetical protein
MTHPEEPATRGRKSGGPWAAPGRAAQEPPSSEEAAGYQSVPPEERVAAEPSAGTAAVVRTIVVRDERGRLVSVTKIAPDAKFGVGVKPQPGHTATEFEAGTLAEDPFGAGGTNRPDEQSNP